VQRPRDVRLTLILVVVAAVVACSSSDRSKTKNDDIAACTSSGGRWVEGGCNEGGRCERPSPMAPEDNDDPPAVQDESE
jgi:hypothetical protein